MIEIMGLWWVMGVMRLSQLLRLKVWDLPWCGQNSIFYNFRTPEISAHFCLKTFIAKRCDSMRPYACIMHLTSHHTSFIIHNRQRLNPEPFLCPTQSRTLTLDNRVINRFLSDDWTFIIFSSLIHPNTFLHPSAITNPR